MSKLEEFFPRTSPEFNVGEASDKLSAIQERDVYLHPILF